MGAFLLLIVDGVTMAKEFAKQFYKGQKWRQCRRAYIKMRQTVDGGMCERCHERLGYIVHHTVLLTPDNINDPNISLNYNLLEFVCKPCHDYEEGHFLYREEKEKRFYFSEDGTPIPK